MLLMIDNYDSFTYNLVQYLEVLGKHVKVVRNDEITAPEAGENDPEAIVISPGPCTPAQAGISVEVVRQFSGRIPILGVCLGLQSISVAFGAEIRQAGRMMHGKVSKITHDGKGVFAGLKSPFPAIRYHSLATDPDTVPDCLVVTATSEDGEIMGLRHKQHTTLGIQFHPESILTPAGKRLLANFLKLAAGKETGAASS